METLHVETRSRCELRDITAEVREVVRARALEEGIAVVYCPHTTAGIAINENADPSVKRDFLMLVEKRVPHREDYRHSEGNSDSHIKSILTGAAQTIPVTGGELALGTWQGIFLAEYDGPRHRKVHVQVVPA